jgi:hypothetical protein
MAFTLGAMTIRANILLALEAVAQPSKLLQ